MPQPAPNIQKLPKLRQSSAHILDQATTSHRPPNHRALRRFPRRSSNTLRNIRDLHLLARSKRIRKSSRLIIPALRVTEILALHSNRDSLSIIAIIVPLPCASSAVDALAWGHSPDCGAGALVPGEGLRIAGGRLPGGGVRVLVAGGDGVGDLAGEHHGEPDVGFYGEGVGEGERVAGGGGSGG